MATSKIPLGESHSLGNQGLVDSKLLNPNGLCPSLASEAWNTATCPAVTKPLPLSRASASAKPSPPSTASPTAKRPHSEAESTEEISDDDPRLQYISDNCNQVRRKIHDFINSGAMKVGEFQSAIGVTTGSYARFMKQNGPQSGYGSDTYEAAATFFKKRELQGIMMPKKKVKKADEDKKMDVSDIHLDGEDTESVEVYYTCDEVRRKIAVYLREEGVTKAGFLRELRSMFPEPKPLQSKQLQDFQSKSGPLAGNTSRVYYAAYVFFEKLRLKQGKKKSKA
ncbi:hypothetical protein MMC30_008795 [Trapelia coarctata]|nr:hypothetical protein [Trapelia coarctata]